MITPDEIRVKAGRLYLQAIHAWLFELPFFPRTLRADLLPPDIYSEALMQQQALRAGSKEVLGHGYTVTWESRNSRRYGRQDFAASVYFDSLDDLLRLIGKVKEFRRLERGMQLIRQRQPRLVGWAQDNWRSVIRESDDLPALLDVVEYFQAHPRPNCFLRELPLAISTKLVEEHAATVGAWLEILTPEAVDFGFDRHQFAQRYGFRSVDDQLLLRILDLSLQAELQCPGNEISLPIATLATLPADGLRAIIVENKVNLLTLPTLPRTVALGGLGKAVTRLFPIQWLDRCQLWYWGDLDIEGFQILSQVRRRWPTVRSLMMDRSTLNRFEKLIVAGNLQASDLAIPSELKDEEAFAFADCREHNLRLEQERIAQVHVNEVLQKALNGC